MAITDVSEAFAFVARHGEFTKAILFAEDEVPEIQPQEREAIQAVYGHARDSYVGLLGCCRDILHERGDSGFQKVMERNWNRASSLWDRAYVEVPLHIESAYVFACYFYINEEPSRPGVLSLYGDLWMQTRRSAPLFERGAQAGPPLIQTTTGYRVLAPELTQGLRFEDLATNLVEVLWPVIVDVRARLLSEGQRRQA
jgi:hypothetical protein